VLSPAGARALWSHLSPPCQVVLVEWNPCYANGKAEEGACDARDDGYLSLEQVLACPLKRISTLHHAHLN